MQTQYYCRDARRQQEVAASENGLNGIDYLEVVDRDYVAMLGEDQARPLRQRTLLVRCLKLVPEELQGENVCIDGGVRVTLIGVQWAAVATKADDLLADGMILQEERDFLMDDLPENDHVLVVRTETRGDFSTYRLSLVASQSESGPPVGFDELLSHVDFSFKVECPSEFDCGAASICPPEIGQEPVIDYLNKDYASFRRLILDRLSVIMPDWQERNPADLGVTLVELLAYAGDRLSYFQDAVGAEAYLGTARRRVSVRRHARLLDYAMHDGCNARAWVSFEVEPESDGAVLKKTTTVPTDDKPTVIPARLLTKIPAEVVVAAHEFEQLLALHQPEVFELMHDLPLYESHNEIKFYLWTDQKCCLPKGATQATLIDCPLDEDGNFVEAQRLRLRAGDTLIFEERLAPSTGQAADADPTRRHAVRLTEVAPEAELSEDGGRTAGTVVLDPLNGQPIVNIEWDAADALPFPLCISIDNGAEPEEEVSIARGNVVLADHGRTVAEEELSEVPPASSRSRYRPRLQETGVTFSVPDDATASAGGAASEAVIQEPSDALPAGMWLVMDDDDDDEWVPQRDLLDSDRFDPHFVCELEADGVAQLRFARQEDLAGLTPPAKAQPKATYRVGNGTRGNVGAEAIAHLVVESTSQFGGVKRVRNPLPASGGIEPESSERVRLDAPQAFRVQQRAVTEADYAEVAQRHLEVQKAVATRRWTGSWHTMFVTVDRLNGAPVDDEFCDELRDFLEQFRLVGHDLKIDSPRFVPLDVVMTVCTAAGYFAGDVKQALVELFSKRDLPDGSRGFFHPDNLTFGQPVYVSSVIAAAMQVPGVRWVDLTDHKDTPNRFRRFGEESHGEFDDGLIKLGRLEIARLDNDPSLPENGKIDFLMEGGS